jgi:hypothetical protein
MFRWHVVAQTVRALNFQEEAYRKFTTSLPKNLPLLSLDGLSHADFGDGGGFLGRLGLLGRIRLGHTGQDGASELITDNCIQDGLASENAVLDRHQPAVVDDADDFAPAPEG